MKVNWELVEVAEVGETGIPQTVKLFKGLLRREVVKPDWERVAVQPPAKEHCTEEESEVVEIALAMLALTVDQ